MELHLYRLWCKKCKNYELHYSKSVFDDKDFYCKSCDTKYTDIKLSEIPKDKILEQRERYNIEQHRQFNDIMSLKFLNPMNQFVDMFSEVGSKKVVHEADAGQAAIDEIQRQKRVEEQRIQLLKRKEELAEAKRYAKLNRNDICLCGSGKKYKNCCLHKIESYN